MGCLGPAGMAQQEQSDFFLPDLEKENKMQLIVPVLITTSAIAGGPALAGSDCGGGRASRPPPIQGPGTFDPAVFALSKLFKTGISSTFTCDIVQFQSDRL